MLNRNPNKPQAVPFNWHPATSGHNMEYLEIGKKQIMKKNLASQSRLWDSLPLWHNVKERRLTDEL